MKFAIYEPSSLIIGSIDSASHSDALQSAEGLGQIKDVTQLDLDLAKFQYSLVENVVQKIPNRPSPNHKWTGDEWVDDRTDEDRAQQTEQRLQALRSAATLTKLQFVMAVVNAQILSRESGLALLDGQIPQELNGLVSSMDDTQQFEMAAKLKAASHFDRLDPFVVASGQYLGLTAEQMDTVYGIPLDPPAPIV